jgi:ribonuclease VapC
VIVDTSAIIAILRRESAAQRCLVAIERAPVKIVSAATLLEASIVILRKGEFPTLDDIDLLLTDYEITIEPVTETQARIARLAYRQYGKGIHAKAQLNFGDCFAYALARERNEPLLFVGDDFAHTDIRSALA